MKKDFYTTSEAAKLLGISRVAVFKQIKSGKLPAHKIGRAYAIAASALPTAEGKLSESQKRIIEEAVEKTVDEYGQTLKLLGAE